MGSLPDDGSLNEMPLENGYHNSRGDLIKKRKVTIIRDYPPGCGRKAPYLATLPHGMEPPGSHFDKEEMGADQVRVNTKSSDCGKDSEIGNPLMLHDSVKIPMELEWDDPLDKIVGKVKVDFIESSPKGKNKTTLELGCVTDGMALGGVAKKWSPSQGPIGTIDMLNESVPEISYPRKRVTVIRDYPAFCGRNAPYLTEEELRKLTADSKASEAQVKAAGLGVPLRKTMKTKDGGNPLRETEKRRIKLVNWDARDGYPQKRNSEGVESLPQLKPKSLKVSMQDKPVVNTLCANVKFSPVKDRARGTVKQNLLSKTKASYKNKGVQVIRLKGSLVTQEQSKDSPAVDSSRDIEVIVPHFGPSSSGDGHMRNKVRETLRLFHAICRKILQGEEAKLGYKGNAANRIDLQAAHMVKEKGKEVNKEKQRIGPVPGVEVGDAYQYRVELALIGVHRLYQGGIDYMKHGNHIVAASIVASGGYADDVDSGDVLIYTGQGGNVVGKKEKIQQPQDQKLVRGNLALKNSISEKTPVRVIRGYKESKLSATAKQKVITAYTYDGLYNVERCWQEVGSHGKLVFMFELKRIDGQPELAWKEVKKRKSKTREGLCCDDISGGKERFPISAINRVDDEKPPKFNYITKMKFPDRWCPAPAMGCDCVKKCVNSHNCSCVTKNGEFPYNYDGAIVEVKPLVYECGPSCKCPPSCYNRVSQHGIKIQLEIFKTKSRGWGVRSLSSIPSGSFICEYLGELLEDIEAEKRENDEYLFDIGQNYNDCSLPSAEKSSEENLEDGGFTIDAAEFGNVGRFINHSCSPNLYAQNVLYDHGNKRMPHIMLFAADNIPPLQELTYHYNYAVNQYKDSDGNVKTKNCYCGSEECTGRMY